MGPAATSSIAWHYDYFISKLGSWASFEMRVRNARRIVELDSSPIGCTFDNAALHMEQLICGDESTVQARFQANVGHPMTAIYQSLHINARFSDAAACPQPLAGTPDIICLELPEGKPLLVGEIKTWWMHDLEMIWGTELRLRHALGRLFDTFIKFMVM
jgi:hypothetical protein